MAYFYVGVNSECIFVQLILTLPISLLISMIVFFSSPLREDEIWTNQTQFGGRTFSDAMGSLRDTALFNNFHFAGVISRKKDKFAFFKFVSVDCARGRPRRSLACRWCPHGLASHATIY